MMTTNVLFVLSLVVIVVVSLFVGQLLPGVESEFGVGDDGGDIEAPSVWDVALFAAGTFWAMLTFQIPGVHWVLGVVFWFMAAINLWCLVRLVRGVS